MKIGKRLIMVAGIVVFALGVVVAFSSVSAGGVDCGSAFSPADVSTSSGGAGSAADRAAQEDCDGAITTRSLIVGVLFLFGIMAGIFGYLAQRSSLLRTDP